MVDGKKVPSVTQILAPLHAETALAANPILRDQAASRGSRVHEATALWDYDGDITEDLIDAETAPYIAAYVQWKRDYNPRMLKIEFPMAYRDEFAGTVDRIAEIDGEIVIIDIKTGSSVDVRAVSAQCYAYSFMAEAYGIKAKKLYVLQLKKDGKYSFRELKRMRGERFWNLCWELYTAIRDDKERKK